LVLIAVLAGAGTAAGLAGAVVASAVLGTGAAALVIGVTGQCAAACGALRRRLEDVP